MSSATASANFKPPPDQASPTFAHISDRDGNPWFAVADICRVLGISNTSDATNYLDQTEVNRLKLTAGRGPSNLIISESGLYKLVLRSDKAEAKPFQDWVTKVVLPAIRKDGAYVAGEEKVATGEMSEDEFILRAVIHDAAQEHAVFCGISFEKPQDDVPGQVRAMGQLFEKSPFKINGLDKEFDNHPHMRETPMIATSDELNTSRPSSPSQFTFRWP
ncbi:BRO-N domain-containing protein [Paracoccus benzoatiresistens]|uniref:BRO family protein n=1 Tax=Paracoccus benzoatiresistens TaxID=2997341 RepID=A0ABT4J1C9_9RHOB|nr:BRO family protein [Paracoccus sp. EF6]MCZ0960901.1 BRO family protein [Paracoccus sp. EF6]